MVNLGKGPLAPWDDTTDLSLAAANPWTWLTPMVAPDTAGAPSIHAAPVRVGTLSRAAVVVATAAQTTPSPTEVTSATSPMIINLDWDSSVSSAPSGFMTDVIAAARYLESQFANAVTLTFDVGYNEVGGDSLDGGALGESLSNLNTVSYASLRGAVASSATTATDASVVASLPATTPVIGANYWVTDAQQKALGLAPANGTEVDGSVGFGLASEFTYGDTATTGTVTPGTYDFFATVVHELTEVMGRQMLTGSTEGAFAKSYTLLDLLHYSAAATRDFSASTAGYFSPDSGVSDLGDFNTLSSGDAGDWASSVSDDPFDAFASSGVLEPVSANDLTELDAIGWKPVSSGTQGQSPTAPTGVTASVVSSSLASAQVNKGLAANAPLATFGETGGTAADSFLYTLGGTGAASFALVTANNGATLSVGATALLGKPTGTLFSLTVSATDETAALTSPADPFNVVLGGNGNDTIHLASLAGIATAAPTFISGLGGIDTIDGTGMTGTLFFDSGSGADTMTGGSGVNVFGYGAAADSTASAMDIITNFSVALDVIDLTGLGAAFTAAVALGAATTIAAEAIGWQTSGGNTFVYANSGTRTEALTAANMKIELKGVVALTASNFLHD